MLYRCALHGDVESPICVSRSIFDCIRNRNGFSGKMRRVCVVHPTYLNKLSTFYLDDEDFSRVVRYIESIPKFSRNEMLISASSDARIEPGDPFLVDRDKAKRRLNDRLFLKEIGRRLESTCPECLKEKFEI